MSTARKTTPDASGSSGQTAGKVRKDHNAEWDADDPSLEEWQRKGPQDVRDKGVLDSIGEAVSSPVRDAAEGDAAPPRGNRDR